MGIFIDKTIFLLQPIVSAAGLLFNALISNDFSVIYNEKVPAAFQFYAWRNKIFFEFRLAQTYRLGRQLPTYRP